MVRMTILSQGDKRPGHKDKEIGALRYACHVESSLVAHKQFHVQRRALDGLDCKMIRCSFLCYYRLYLKLPIGMSNKIPHDEYLRFAKEHDRVTSARTLSWSCRVARPFDVCAPSP